MIESAEVWAEVQWGRVALGDERLRRRAVEIGRRMAERPEASLPSQMGEPRVLKGAYRLLNHPEVTLEQLTAGVREETLRLARQEGVVLMVEDTTELDYSGHWGKTGLGPIGDGGGRGLLLHSTLAVKPESGEVLGLAHLQAVLRGPQRKGKGWTRSAEGRVWEVSAEQVGSAPAGVVWVHVSDSGSDIFEYMATCRDLGKHFVVRAHKKRLLLWPEEKGEGETPTRPDLMSYARSLPAVAGSGYGIEVPAEGQQAARQAALVMAFGRVTIPPSPQAPQAVRQRAPVQVWVLRAWEPNPPEGAEAVEWILLSSLPITSLEQARQCLAWYTRRWLCEDYHQCLKTGCRIEHSQLDDGADLQRLLGFAAPIAVRLLQLRQLARQAPDTLAMEAVEPLMVQVLAAHQHLDWRSLSIAQFWRQVALLGGYQGRRADGPPGWRTLWHGFLKLSEWTHGARLFAPSPPNQQ